ncbi:MAG: LysM peptidoglycan-binding domain-containing protein, partial [Oscillospiraceae bacterium]|nr:LysM peptidoglycan-binding domain-containing protein [Oscillospiraceae bacterium]
QVSVTAENCAYTLTGACEVTVKAELRMEGTVTHCTRTEAVAEITLPDGEAQPRDYALLLYFGRAGEPVWDIAKRCRTSVDAILDENDLAGDVLPEDAMLLIPIVG